MSAGTLHVEVQGRDIIVTLPGTNFMVTYFKPAGTSHLIARPNWTSELGWIVWGVMRPSRQ